MQRVQQISRRTWLARVACQSEMRILSFIDQPDVIRKILDHLGLWEEAHAPPYTAPPKAKEITFDPSTSQLTYESFLLTRPQMSSPARGPGLRLT